MKKIIYEQEGYDDPNAVDTIWVRDGRGKLVEVEVEDDVADD